MGEREPKFNYKLADFKDEVRDMVMVEKRTGTTSHFADIPEFSPADLTEADMRIWEKIEDESVTREDFEEYKKTIFTDQHELRPEAPQSRYDFMQFIANKMMAIFAERAIREMDRSDQNK